MPAPQVRGPRTTLSQGVLPVVLPCVPLALRHERYRQSVSPWQLNGHDHGGGGYTAPGARRSCGVRVGRSHAGLFAIPSRLRAAERRPVICGIAGWYSWSESRLTREQITHLWKENEFRGKDAAGISYLDGKGELYFVKEKGKATELAKALSDEVWGKAVASPLGLLHTRQKTTGSENENENNHPVAAYSWLVTHNGIITNDDSLFTYFGAERPAEVDTVAINLVLGRGDTLLDSLRHAGTLDGAASVAAIHSKRPKEVVLFRLGGADVHLYWLPTQKMLVWSSDKDGHRALSGMFDSSVLSDEPLVTLMSDKSALHLTPEGIKRYALTPSPFRDGKTKVRMHGSSTSFFNSARPTTGGGRGTATGGATKKKSSSGGGSSVEALLLSDRGLLEDPLWFGSLVEYHMLGRYLHMVTPEKLFVIPTAYGRWILNRTPEGALGREFRPHRRVRNRWALEFGEEYQISLPAVGSLPEDLSNLLMLAPVLFGEQESKAFMCPWCGVLHHPIVWEQQGYKCAWCEVTSNVPTIVSWSP